MTASAPAAYASERAFAFAASMPAKISSGVGCVTAPPLRPFGCWTTMKYAVAARSSAAATVIVFVPAWCVTVGYPDANCACEVTACAPTSAGAAQLAKRQRQRQEPKRGTGDASRRVERDSNRTRKGLLLASARARAERDALLGRHAAATCARIMSECVNARPSTGARRRSRGCMRRMRR